MEIAISSIAYLGKPVEAFIESCIQNDFIPEFSSGMPYKENMVQTFLSAKTKKKYAHNYFPAPEVPFVLNLASANKEIRKKSIAHCVQGLQLSEKAGAPFFSAHAGFCIDPDPNELGQQLSRSKTIDRKLHYTAGSAISRRGCRGEGSGHCRGALRPVPRWSISTTSH